MFLVDWDTVKNEDFKSDCLLGFFRNHPIDDPSRLGERFGCLTAVKSESGLGGARYEESYHRRWEHFRLATREEIQARTTVAL